MLLGLATRKRSEIVKAVGSFYEEDSNAPKIPHTRQVSPPRTLGKKLDIQNDLRAEVALYILRLQQIGILNGVVQKSVNNNPPVAYFELRYQYPSDSAGMVEISLAAVPGLTAMGRLGKLIGGSDAAQGIGRYQRPQTAQKLPAAYERIGPYLGHLGG